MVKGRIDKFQINRKSDEEARCLRVSSSMIKCPKQVYYRYAGDAYIPAEGKRETIMLIG